MNAAIERFENPPEPETIHPKFDSVIRPVPETEVPDEVAGLLQEIHQRYADVAGEREMSADEQKTILTNIVQELAGEKPHIHLALFNALKKFLDHTIEE